MIMNRSKLYLSALIIVVVVGALWYRQYKIYRTPVTESNDPEIQALLEPSSREVTQTNGVLHSIPLDEVITGNPVKDGIPSIDKPKFQSVGAADQYLDDNGFGLAVEVNGEYRFYPYQILVWHEIVNETFNGQDLLVTYCPLCFTGIVFERDFGGDAVEFGTSGKLWNSNLLMYDRTSDSLWSQALGEAVVGERTGSKLKLYPSLTISWTSFKTEHPGGRVLSSDTGFSRDYTQDPYEPRGYYTSSTIMFPLSNEDSRLFSKALVFGYKTDDAQKAFEKDAIEEVGVVNDQVGDEAVLIAWDPSTETVRGYSRQVDTAVLTFTQGDDFLVDDQTGSLWNYEGEAVSGDYRGRTLSSLVLENSFWFSWAASHPNTELFTSNE